VQRQREEVQSREKECSKEKKQRGQRAEIGAEIKAPESHKSREQLYPEGDLWWCNVMKCEVKSRCRGAEVQVQSKCKGAGSEVQQLQEQVQRCRGLVTEVQGAGVQTGCKCCRHVADMSATCNTVAGFH
jgi:hypothetical protein